MQVGTALIHNERYALSHVSVWILSNRRKKRWSTMRQMELRTPIKAEQAQNDIKNNIKVTLHEVFYLKASCFGLEIIKSQLVRAI